MTKYHLYIVILILSFSSCSKEKELSSFEMLTNNYWHQTSHDFKRFDKYTGELYYHQLDTVGEFIPYKFKLNTDYSSQLWLNEDWSFTAMGTWNFYEKEDSIKIDIYSDFINPYMSFPIKRNFGIDVAKIISLTKTELVVMQTKPEIIYNQDNEIVSERILEITDTYINKED